MSQPLKRIDQRLVVPIILTVVLVGVMIGIASITSAAGPSPVKNALGYNQFNAGCSTTGGDRVGTNFGVVVTPNHSQTIWVTGQASFFTSSTSKQPINYFVYQSLNTTVPSCSDIIDFTHKPNDFKICSFSTEEQASVSFNEEPVPVTCSNINNGFNAVVIGSPVLFYIAMMNAAGGGYTLSSGSSFALVAQEF